MGTKALVIFVFWLVAVILFLAPAIFMGDPGPASMSFITGFRCVAAGLALTVIGFLIDKYWAPAAVA